MSKLTPEMLRDEADLIDRYMLQHLPMPQFLREEAARRERDAGRGHIPMLLCPGSCKPCVGHDCLDRGCLKGEPKGLPVEYLREINIAFGGCEVCTTPTACKQEKHCDHEQRAWPKDVMSSYVSDKVHGDVRVEPRKQEDKP